MRVDAGRCEDILLEWEGSEGGGELADRGSDGQSSEREWSQACSIATEV